VQQALVLRLQRQEHGGLDSEETEKVEEGVREEANGWLDSSQEADKEDYEEKLKELDDVCNAVISAVHQRSGGTREYNDDVGDDHDEI
jgi:endoplasmic reticulum chaperone BiP